MVADGRKRVEECGTRGRVYCGEEEGLVCCGLRQHGRRIASAVGPARSQPSSGPRVLDGPGAPCRRALVFAAKLLGDLQVTVRQALINLYFNRLSPSPFIMGSVCG